MRLIDADALIDELDGVIICENFDAERMIRDMPTVDVLDKIRTEIEQMDFDFGDYYDRTDEIIEMVCKVIDKYRAESEAI